MHETLCYSSYMNCFEIIISSQQCGQLASDDLQCDNCRSIASRQFPIRRVTLSSTWLPLAAILLLSVKSPLCWHQTPSSRHFFGKFVNCDQVQVFFDSNDSFWRLMRYIWQLRTMNDTSNKLLRRKWVDQILKTSITDIMSFLTGSTSKLLVIASAIEDKDPKISCIFWNWNSWALWKHVQTFKFLMWTSF